MEKEIADIFNPLQKLLIFGISPESKNADLTILKFLNSFKLLERNKSTPAKSTNDHNFLDLKSLSDQLKIIDSSSFSETYNSFYSIVDFVKQLIREGNGKAMMTSLKQSASLSYSSKESIVLCLAILTKTEEKDHSVPDAYSAVPQICKSSYLFLLFIQCCKALSYENKSSGWGRGLRKAVRNWYLQWDPCKLILEISRCRKAFTWSHLDIIKLSHIKLKELPEATQAALHYIRRGLEPTIKEYGEKTPEIIHFLKSLHIKEDLKNSDSVISKVKFILEKYTIISLRDFPSRSLNAEIWTFLLKNGTPSLISEALLKTDFLKVAYLNNDLRELLMSKVKEDSFGTENDLTDLVASYNACRKKAIEITEEKDGKMRKNVWKNNAQPAPDKDTKLKGPKILPVQLTCVIDEIGKSITACMEKSPKTKNSASVFIDMSEKMKDFFSVCASDSPAEIRSIQAATLMLQSMAPEKWETITPYFFTKSGPGTMYVPSPCGIHYLKTNMKNIVSGPVNVKAALNKSLESKKDSCIILCREISATVIKDAQEAMKTLKDDQKIRLIICQMSEASSIKLPTGQESQPDLFFVGAFAPSTIAYVKALHERLL